MTCWLCLRGKLRDTNLYITLRTIPSISRSGLRRGSFPNPDPNTSLSIMHSEGTGTSHSRGDVAVTIQIPSSQVSMLPNTPRNQLPIPKQFPYPCLQGTVWSIKQEENVAILTISPLHILLASTKYAIALTSHRTWLQPCAEEHIPALGAEWGEHKHQSHLLLCGTATGEPGVLPLHDNFCLHAAFVPPTLSYRNHHCQHSCPAWKGCHNGFHQQNEPWWWSLTVLGP